MGIRKLNKFLMSKNIINSYQNIHAFVNKFKNNNNTHNNKIVIAVDFWLYIHKFLHSRLHATNTNNILSGFLNQILKFLSSGIIPLYVMDGSIPIEKHNTVESRDNKKTNYKKQIDAIDIEINKYINISDLNSNDVDIVYDNNLNSMREKKEKLQRHIKRISKNELRNIQILFDIIGIPYVKAEYEADAMCAKLYKNKIITSCLSDDMDMLALGCGSTVKFYKGRYIEYNLQEIKQYIGFDQNQFIDMCIMFGCDYLHHPFRLDCNDVYDMIYKHGSLLSALNSNEHSVFNMNNNNIKIIGEHYYRVIDIYLNSHNREYIPQELLDIKMQQIDFNDLYIFLNKINYIGNLMFIEKQILNINQMIINNIL